MEAISEELIPVTDDDIDGLMNEMREKALATDQRNLVREFMPGRSIACRQAGVLLGSVRLGLVQRMIAFEVLQGRISDLPDGLPALLESLSGPIRSEVEANFSAQTDGRLTRTQSMPVRRCHSNFSGEQIQLDSATTAPQCRSKLELVRRQCNWAECVERLRSRVTAGDVSAPLYEDLSAVFEALALGPLPALTPQANCADSSSNAVKATDINNDFALPPPKVHDLILNSAPAAPRKDRPVSAASVRSALSEESV